MSNTYYYTGPSIDHTLLSPSGRCSKSARDAAMKRESAKLFPPGFWDKPASTPGDLAKQKADVLRRTAKTLRDLAARGMNCCRYTREAAKLEEQANSILKG